MSMCAVCVCIMRLRDFDRAYTAADHLDTLMVNDTTIPWLLITSRCHLAGNANNI